MNEPYNATLTLWPATPLPARVAHELHELGVDLSTFTVNDGWLTAIVHRRRHARSRHPFGRHRYGLTDLEAVLATLRLAGISYVAWDIKQGEAAGTGRSFDPATRIERQFTVMAGGEPVLTPATSRSSRVATAPARRCSTASGNGCACQYPTASRN